MRGEGVVAGMTRRYGSHLLCPAMPVFSLDLLLFRDIDSLAAGAVVL